MIKVQINKICAKLIECEPLTAGMIGKTLDVEFSADWNGLTKTAVFSNGDTVIDVLESQWNGNTITIPHEVLADPNRIVNFGIYGYTMSGDDVILAIPTKYVPLGRVHVGADPEGDESTEPSLPVYAQLDLRVTDLEEHGGGGADNIFVVNAYVSELGTTPEIIGTPSATYAQIAEAVLSKKIVALNLRVDDNALGYEYPLISANESYAPQVFGGLIPVNDNYWGAHQAVYISVSNADVWAISYDDYALKSDLGDLSDLDTEDKSNIVAAINEVKQSGGTGWTSAQIDLLEAVFEKLVYTDAEGGAIAAQLINSLRGGVVPEEPITITFDGTKAVISGLGNTTITYSGATAKIGYMPL